MGQGRFARLRSLILLVAFGIGLVGQALAFAPMAMADDDSYAVAASMDGTAHCPGCAGMGDDSSKALTPVNCPNVLCSVSVIPAILPQGPAIAATHGQVFLPIPAKTAQGVSVRPALGPPRPNEQA